MELRGPAYDTVGPNLVYLRRPELPTLIEKRYSLYQLIIFPVISYHTISYRLAEDYIKELAAREPRLRRAYKLEALKRDKRGNTGKSFKPDEYYQGRDPLWNSEW